MLPLQRSPFLEAIQKHDPHSTAIVHSLSGRSFTYGSILQDVAAAKERLLQTTGKDENGIVGERIAFLVENGYDYVVTLLSCLASNAIAVPLAPSFPASELRYILNHSEALALLYSAKFSKLAQEVVKEGLDRAPVQLALEKITEGAAGDAPITLSGDTHHAEGGMMLYTSGTTARPKGVLLPTLVLAAQAHSLLGAWEYTPQDQLLHVLPLHHIHGTVNGMLTPLLAGSTIEFMYPFNERLVAYKIPQDVKVVGEIKRNAMGKVNKKELVKDVFGDQERIRRRSEAVAADRAALKKEAGAGGR
ncbi:hypothetical protein LTR32_004318 [Rachicladosporium monterosium]|uniref:AMP-dependent synthetase/ligase domain-containing protein n=1 Tax=Rachicladosporium monterosium TaxID=1507873 RepID=A0ABR0L6Y0_9PEZI|nr:hypothetical protein LTR32_004318 [Rachicladosporium monterosium]